MPIHIRTTVAVALLAALALCIPLASADDKPATRGKAGDALTPLALGNTWVYESEGDTFINTDRVEGVVLFDGKPWHLIRSYEREKGQLADKDVDVQADVWLAMVDGHECDAFSEMDEDGIVLKLGETTPYFRYPATLGDTYKPVTEDPSIVVTITALNEKVVTQAGEFDCIVYKESNPDEPGYSFTAYVAPGVGIVKLITVEEGETVTTNLTSYTLVENE